MKTTEQKSNRKPTPRQDCEAIAERLPDTAELAGSLKAACGEYLHLELDHAAQRLQDGTSVCLHCGFPFPGHMDRCPNCGTELVYDNKNIKANKKNENFISVLSIEKGETAEWLLQRQFLVESFIGGDYREAQTFQTVISEVYRNFVSQDGKTIVSFRRALAAFASYQLKYQLNKPIKYISKSKYDYGITPKACDIAWHGVVGGELEAELDKRIEKRKN